MTDGKLMHVGEYEDRGRSRRCGGVACAGLLVTLSVLPALGAPAAKQRAAAQDTAAAPAQAPAGMLRIPLAAMGFQPLQQDFLLAGSSMLTVHFVDQDHLLVTFGVRRLMKREADDPAADEDRVIGANLVELPSGKVLAQTEWRVHDRSQYLWPLGHGRFLLRVRDHLTMIAPTAGRCGADPFREYPLLKLERHIVAILTSPDDDLLTVETTRYAMASGETSTGFSLDPAPVEINFFRLLNQGASADGLTVVSAGRIRTQTAVALPIDLGGAAGGAGGWQGPLAVQLR